jgi:alpha-tubulin suppressor-like RCC1 family protein
MDIAAGAVAFRKGVDYSTTGTTNDTPFTNNSLVRLTGAGAQTLSGIAGGTDGKLLTIMNAGVATATLQNQNTGSVAANRIITGTGADMTIGVDQSVLMVYDSGVNRWRVVSGGSNVAAGATINTVQILASSSASNVTLMDASSRFGMYGTMFIYNNQLYSMGAGGNIVAGMPYGNFAVSSNLTPNLVPISGQAPTGWTKVIGDYYNACALSNVGDVWCIGNNDYGQLGLGDTTTRYTLNKITFPSGAAAMTDIVGVSTSRDGAGSAYNMFHSIDANGKVWGWGYNGNTQLGDGTSNNRLSPVAIGDPAFQAKTITKVFRAGKTPDTSTTFSAALASDGSFYTWGYNNLGNLGLGDTSSRSVPTLATTSVVDAALGGEYDTNSHKFTTIIVKADGGVWSAGHNEAGVFGAGNTTASSSFIKATGLPSNVTKVYMGGNSGGQYAAVVTADGYIYTVGENGVGQLGAGGTTNQTTYVQPAGEFQGKVAKVVLAGSEQANVSYSYILTTEGKLYFAGYNGTGAAGLGNTTNVTTGFTQIANNVNGAKVIDVRATGMTSNSGTLIALDNGTMMAAGSNDYGQLGFDVDTTGDHYTFNYVVGFEPGSKGQSLSGNNVLPFTVRLDNLVGSLANSALDNLSSALTWSWSTLTNQTGWTLKANNLAGGTILDITSSSTALNSTNGLFAVRNLGTSTSGMLASFVASSTNSNGLYIKNNGTVGIGTSSPSAMLDLYNSSSTILALNVTGAVAFKAGTDFATSTPVAKNVNFGNASLIRVNATTSAFLGISGIADLTGASTTHVSGRLLTIMNASSTSSFTLFNQSANSSQNNRIITGTGADLVLAADATVLVQYDATAARWRVVGGSGSGGGSTASVQTVTASTTLAGWNRIAKVSPSSTGSITVTLPTAVGFTGQTIQVIDM